MILIKLLSRLPLRALYGIADFLFFITYHVLGYRKKMVKRNLANAFPEKTEAEIQKIRKAFYRNLADYAVETLKLLTISRPQLATRMKFINPEVADKYLRHHQSVIFLASHQFNWEWLVAAGSIYLPAQVDFVYQQQGSQFFNNFSLAIRSRFGAYGIERNQVARELAKRKGLVRCVAVVADQFPGHHNDKRYWTTFLNQRTAFFQSINQMAQMTQFPVYFAFIRKIKRGYYEVDLQPVSVPPYDKETFHVVDEYIKGTETLIRNYPDGWLWSHNRWKNRE